MYEKLIRFASAILGHVDLIADRSWPHRDSIVLEVRDGSGTIAFIKSHKQHSKYEIELETYLQTVPKLGNQAPKYISHDDELNAILISSIPGCSALDTNCGLSPTRIHFQAGKLLRIFHETSKAERFERWHEYIEERLEKWIGRAEQDVLKPSEIRLARTYISKLSVLPDPVCVTTHWDWHPRNWIIHCNKVCVIDFEHTRKDVWFADLQKLWWTIWNTDSHLKDMFLSGYGRQLSVNELPYFRATAALHLISTIVWAYQRSDWGYLSQARSCINFIDYNLMLE